MWKRLAVMKLPILAAREYDAVGKFQETLKTKAGQNSIINRIFHLWNLPITQVCTDFDVCIKLTVFEQFRPPDYENDFGFALSRLVFPQIVFS
jgi:hypothetical protein